jgi:DNA sulfur modification protein DndD
MIFTELVLQNFGPYAGKQVIDLRPQLEDSNRPIILLGAMNGGGKTTFMDGIRLALYGQRAQCSTRGNLGYGEFLNQCIHKQLDTTEKTRIELSFEHILNGKWTTFKIVRFWQLNSKEGKDNLGILVDDWPDEALSKTWDEYIENILPLGISNLFLFDGEQVKELAELEVPPTSVVEAIQSLLGLELAERLSVDLDVLVTRKRKSLASKSALATLEEIEVNLNQQKEDLELAKEDLEFKQQDLLLAQQLFQEASDRFNTEGGKIAEESTQLDNLKKSLEESANKQRQELGEIAAGILPLALILPLLDDAKVQAEQEVKNEQAKIARDLLLERDGRLLSYLQDLSLADTAIDEVKNFLDRENESLYAHIDEQPYIQTTPEEVKQLINAIEHQLPIELKLARDSLEKVCSLDEQIAIADRQLAVAASPEDYNRLKEARNLAYQEVLNAQVGYDRALEKCEQIEKAIVKTKKELEKYSEQAIDRLQEEHIIQAAAKVQNTLKIFKERLTLKKLNKLEGEVTECFRYLLHKSDLVHRVAIETNTFRLSLYDPYGQPLPKHRLSAGEKQLLAIAFLWGLARVSGRNLPIAIDTPLGRLDSSHRNNLVERYFPTASHQVILLSTDTEIGKQEVKQLREQGAIAKEYLLQYDSHRSHTTINAGYFW